MDNRKPTLSKLSGVVKMVIMNATHNEDILFVLKPTELATTQTVIMVYARTEETEKSTKNKKKKSIHNTIIF
tara:strand:- start:33 stop:248 length:216 start_codon:yes stop_codon:yes gene_type:complete